MLPVGRSLALVTGRSSANGAELQRSDRFTLGGSRWYGSAQVEAEGAQWKSAEVYAVSIGLRCFYLE